MLSSTCHRNGYRPTAARTSSPTAPPVATLSRLENGPGKGAAQPLTSYANGLTGVQPQICGPGRTGHGAAAAALSARASRGSGRQLGTATGSAELLLLVEQSEVALLGLVGSAPVEALLPRDAGQ